MRSRARALSCVVAVIGLALGVNSTVSAAGHAGGHAGGGAHGGGGMHGGGGHYAGAHGGVAVRSAPAGGHVAAHRTAAGTSRYGYYYGPYYGHGYWGGYPYWGYPYWGWGYPYYWGSWWYPYGSSWSVGFGYGPFYGSYYYGGGGGDEGDEEQHEQPHSGNAVAVTNVSPSGAEVSLDGENVGFAKDYNGRWDRLTVVPGHHTITFRSAGYKTLAIEFDAHPGRTYTFNETLSPGSGEEKQARVDPAPPQQEARGRLRLSVAPPDAAVYLDGAYLGLGVEIARMHGSLAVAAGTHQLEVVRPGYVSAKRTIDVPPSDVASADLTLQPEP